MSRLAAALAAIDAANAEDPNQVVIRGRARPKELGHAELVTEWVERLDPGATEPQLLAARASHLRRWASPRADFPDGRAGYLRWRTAAKKRHADDVAALLATTGYGPEPGDDELIDRVQAIIRKEGLGRDPAVQVHEDALCLVFLETQLDELGASLGDDRTVDVLARTIRKMSPAALEAAGSLPLTAGGRALLDQALATVADEPPSSS